MLATAEVAQVAQAAQVATATPSAQADEACLPHHPGRLTPACGLGSLGSVVTTPRPPTTPPEAGL